MKFEICRGQDGLYFFRTADSSGITLLTSRALKEKKDVMADIAEFRRQVFIPSCIEKKKTGGGQFFFTVLAHDDKILATGALFETSAFRDRWLNELQQMVLKIDVVEVAI